MDGLSFPRVYVSLPELVPPMARHPAVKCPGVSTYFAAPRCCGAAARTLQAPARRTDEKHASNGDSFQPPGATSAPARPCENSRSKNTCSSASVSRPFWSSSTLREWHRHPRAINSDPRHVQRAHGCSHWRSPRSERARAARLPRGVRRCAHARQHAIRRGILNAQNAHFPPRFADARR